MKFPYITKYDGRYYLSGENVPCDKKVEAKVEIADTPIVQALVEDADVKPNKADKDTKKSNKKEK